MDQALESTLANTASMQKIKRAVLESISKGKLADIIIHFKVVEVLEEVVLDPVVNTEAPDREKEVEQLDLENVVVQLHPEKEDEKLDPEKEVEQLEPEKEVEQLEPDKEVDQLQPEKEVEQLDPEKEVVQLDEAVESTEILDGEEDVKTLQQESAAVLADSMAVVIDILENQKDRLPIVWKLFYETNKISVNGADKNLIELIAAVDNVEYIDECEASETKKPKIWSKIKSVWKSKK